MSACSRCFVLVLALASGLLAVGAAFPAEPAPEKKIRLDRYGDPLPPRVIARLGTVRMRGVQCCLAFSPDGKWLAGVTGNAEDCATLWEVATGREVRRINGLGRLWKLAFSPDGKRLACSGQRCWVFEVASGKELYSVEGASGDFSGDGKMLVTSGMRPDGPQGYVWDAATGRQLRQWSSEKGVKGAIASVGGQTLAIHLWERRPDEVEIRDIATGKKLRSLRQTARNKPNSGLPDGWRYVTLSRDDKTLAVTNRTAGGGSDVDVELLDVKSGKTLFSWRGHISNRCVFSPDSKRVAWTADGKVGRGTALWVGECDSGKIRVIHEPGYMMQPPCFSPNGRLLAGLTMTFAVTLRDVETGKEVSFLDECDRNVSFTALTPNGRHVLTRSGEGTFFVREARSGRLLRRVSVPFVGREFIEHILPEGRLLTVDPDGDVVRLRNVLTGEVDRCFAAARPDFGPPVSVPAPGNRHVAVHRRDGSVAVFDLRTKEGTYRLHAAEARQGLKLSAGGDVLVWYNRADGKPWFSERDGKANIRVHRKASGKTFVLPNLPKGDRWVSSFRFYSCLSPDGRWLILPMSEGPMRRWGATTGMEKSPLAEPLHSGHQLCWSPDHRILAMRGSPFRIEGSYLGVPWEWGFWDVVQGVRLKHLKLPNTMSLVCFAPDGRTLLSGDEQGVIHLWETATGEERAALTGHLSCGIGELALSADGRLLVSSGGDSQILVWDVTGHNPDGKWRLSKLSPEQRRAAWDALEARDARAAYAALWQLAADPEGAFALLGEHLRPIPRPAPGQVARLIVELDAAKFAERERAAEELEKLGQTIVADLRQNLSYKPSLKIRRRIEMLLEKMEGLSQGRELQALRALEVLEHIGTPTAGNLLRKIAEGAPGTRLTEQARQSLHRLEKRTSP